MTPVRNAIASALLAASLAACGFSGSPPSGVANASAALPQAFAQTGRRVALDVRLRIVVPPRRSGDRPSYVSPSTQSLVYVVTQSGADVPGGSGYVNLTPSSPQCVAAVALTCTVTIPLEVTGSGTYAFALATYDEPQSGSSATAPCTPPDTSGCAGKLLSQDLESQNLLEGRINTVPFTLGGIPAGIRIEPVHPGYVQGGGAGTHFALALYGAQPQGVTIDALDAGGNVIVGPGRPALAAVSESPSQLEVVPVVASNVFVLRAVTSGRPPVVTPGAAALTITATPVASSAGSALVVDGTVSVQHKIVYVTTQGGAGSILEYFDDNVRPSVRLDLSPLIWPLSLGGIATERAPGAAAAAFIAGPYHLTACPPDSTAGRQCRNVAPGLFAPSGVAADARSNVYVANATGAIWECAPASSSRSACTTAAHFLPLDESGVAVDAARTLYVANPISGRVSACPAGAETLRRCTTRWKVRGAFGVALGRDGQAYVTTPSGGTVSACAPAGTCSAAFTVRGASAIALDAAGTAYVVDARDDTIWSCTTTCNPILNVRADYLHARWIAVVPAP